MTKQTNKFHKGNRVQNIGPMNDGAHGTVIEVVRGTGSVWVRWDGGNRETLQGPDWLEKVSK